MRKNYIACVMAAVLLILTGSISAYSEQASFEQMVSEWNSKNPELQIKDISSDVKDYVNSLPQNIQLELYKRDTPDQRKQFTRMGAAPFL